MPKDHRERPERFARLLHSTIDDPRFNQMSLAERGAWVTLLLYQDTIYPSCLHRGSVVVEALLGPDHDAVIDGLRDLGLLDDLDDGEFDVHGIENFHVMPSQTPEAVAERVRRHRAKARGEAVRHSVTMPPVTPVTGVTSETDETIHETIRDETRRDTLSAPAPAPAPTRGTNGVSPEGHAIQDLAEELTQQPYVLANLHSKMGEMAMRQVAAHGLERVTQVWREVAEDSGGLPTIRQVILGADDRLNPIPSAPSAKTAAERERESILREMKRGLH